MGLVTAHHGTTRAFAQFDPAHWVSDGAGFFFTTHMRFARCYAHGPHGRVITALLDVGRTYRVNGDAWARAEGLSPREAMDAGFDSYLVSPYPYGDIWIVFDPSRIHVLDEIPKTTDGPFLALSERIAA